MNNRGVERQLVRLLPWGNGRSLADPPGSASVPRVYSGLSQSSDSRLPKGEGSSVRCKSARVPQTWEGGDPGVSNSGKWRGPCAYVARYASRVTLASFHFGRLLFSSHAGDPCIRGPNPNAQLARRARIQKQNRRVPRVGELLSVNPEFKRNPTGRGTRSPA